MTPACPRSYLFVPGNRPGRFDKAASSGADAIILDLEDAVPGPEKAAAREAIATWLQEARPAVRIHVRVNAADSAAFDEDARFVDGLADAVGVMLPKAEPESVRRWAARNGDARELIALVETVRGVLHVRPMLALGRAARVAFGDVDFAVDSGIQAGPGGEELAWIRTQLVLESRLAGLPAPIDGVTLDVGDAEAATHDALRARRFGFGAKMCIHPRQVAAVNAAFRPTAAQLEWARGVLDADAASAGAAVTYLGAMVDRPVVERARRLLLEAGHTP